MGFHLFAISGEFWSPKNFPNPFTQQMSLFLKDLIRQGIATIYIDAILLMSNVKSHMLQLIKRFHDIASIGNLKLVPESFSSISSQ